MSALIPRVATRSTRIALAWLVLGTGLVLALLQASAPGSSGASGFPVLVMGAGLFALLVLYRNALFPHSR